MQPKRSVVERWAVGGLVALPGLFVTIVAWAAQVKPSDANVNLQEWHKTLLGRIPAWLTTDRALGLLAVVVSLFYLWVFRAYVRQVGSIPGRVGRAVRAFGAPPPPTREQAIEHAAAINEVRAFFHNHCMSVAGRVDDLMAKLRNERVFRHVIFAPLADKEFERMGKARSHLETTLSADEPTIDAVRAALLDFHCVYVSAATSALQGEKVTHELTEQPFAGVYRAWEEQHDAYVERLNALVKHRGVSPIGGMILAAGVARAEDHKWSVLFQVAHRTIDELTPPERTFLQLFTEQDPILLRGNDPPPMIHVVYQAGLGLVRKKFLLKRDVGTAIERFTIREPAQSAWSHFGPGSLARTEIDLPLNRVMGTGASGGGA